MGPGFESPPGHHVGASCISLALTFLQKVRVRSFRCSSFPTANRYAGFAVGFGRGTVVSASKVFTLSSSSQASYRLRRVFYASHQKLIVRSFCCSSLPNRIRFAGFRFGLERTERFCLENAHAFRLAASVRSLAAVLCTGRLGWRFCWQGKTLM